MFGNSVGNNNNNDKSINTKIRTFYSDLSCLQVTYWNENISLKINPLLSVTADGIRQYDYNRRANTALTADKCMALKEMIDDKILPKIKEVSEKKKLDKPINVGTQVGNKGTAVFFEYKEDEKKVPTMYLTVYTGIGQDNKAPKDGVYSYKFAKVTTVENYDPETGTGTENTVEAEFMFLYEKIKNIADICGTAAHSIATESAFKTNAGKNGNYSSNGNAQQAAQPQYNAPVSNFNADEFSFDLG